jgi:hypothetical protein
MEAYSGTLCYYKHRILYKNLKIKIYKTMSLPIALYGCETWSLTLMEERRVYEYTALRRIFGLKREEVAGGWRRPHNEKLHNLYASPNIMRVTKSRRMRWVGHVTRIGEMRNAYNTSGAKPEGKKTRKT